MSPGVSAPPLVLYHPPPLDRIPLGACQSTQHPCKPSPMNLSLRQAFRDVHEIQRWRPFQNYAVADCPSFPFMDLLCSIISVNYKTEMYNRLVLSEGAAAIEALRKKCEKWQGSSISEYTMTTPSQLRSSVLVERVNTLLSSMKKEMAIVDSNFCNELRNLKSGHDNISSTRGDIISVADLHNDKISAAKLNSSAEGKDVLIALPKAGSETTPRSASQGKNFIKSEKTFTKPASQAQHKTPIEHNKLKTKAKPQTTQQNSPRLEKTAKPTSKAKPQTMQQTSPRFENTSKKTSKKPVCNSKL